MRNENIKKMEIWIFYYYLKGRHPTCPMTPVPENQPTDKDEKEKIVENQKGASHLGQ